MTNVTAFTPSETAAPSIGSWSMLGNTTAASVMAQIGADWLVLDGQHGLYDDRSVVESLGLLTARATTPPVLVRVPRNDEAWIGRALDAGATGVVIPMVQDGEQARRAADACRYAPDGSRSWGPMAAYWGGVAPSPATANAAVVCAVMVETPEAVGNIADIAGAPGVDMVFVGPFDLSIALGVELQELLDDESETSALRRVSAACREAGVVAGAFAGSVAAARKLVAHGFQAVAVAVDTAILAQAGRDLVDEARTIQR